jgi:hypothetical protein
LIKVDPGKTTRPSGFLMIWGLALTLAVSFPALPAQAGSMKKVVKEELRQIAAAIITKYPDLEIRYGHMGTLR